MFSPIYALANITRQY